MKKHLRSILGAGLALALSLSALAAPVLAATVVPLTGYIPNLKLDGVLTANGNYTNATTTPTIIPGTTFVLPYSNANYGNQYLRVCYYADVTKATSTTGSISVYVNGTNVGASMDRFVAAVAGRNTISNCAWLQRPAAAFGASTTIALYGASQDTAALTVTNATLEVWRATLGG